jgi:hypothetical protein
MTFRDIVDTIIYSRVSIVIYLIITTLMYSSLTLLFFYKNILVLGLFFTGWMIVCSVLTTIMWIGIQKEKKKRWVKQQCMYVVSVKKR